MFGGPSQYTLRFVAGKYKGGEYPLPNDREIVIGRNSDLDIALVEEMVSRRHARITANGPHLLIQDMNSTNGTFVNGERITSAIIKPGDRILIGTNILKLIPANEGKLRLPGSASKEELNAMLQAQSKQPAQESLPTTGTLGDIPLPDLLQLFATNKKNGVLVLKKQEETGKIYLRSGMIYYAIFNNNDDLGPLKAIFRLTGWTDAAFRFMPPTDEEFMLEMEMPTEQLLQSTLRERSEYNALVPYLPENEDMLSISQPLEPLLSDLDPDLLGMLQLAHNHSFYQTILNHSPYSDLQTAKMLKELLDRSYLRI